MDLKDYISKYLEKISYQISSIQQEVVEIKVNVERIIEMQFSKKMKEKKFNIQIPLKTISEFTELEKKIQDNEDLKNEMVSFVIDGTIIEM